MKTTTTIISTALALLLAVAGCNSSKTTTTAAMSCQEAVPIFDADHGGSISDITDFRTMQIEIKDDDIDLDHPLWYLSSRFDLQSLPLEIKNNELICHALRKYESSGLLDIVLRDETLGFYCLSLPFDEGQETYRTYTPDNCLAMLRENAGN